MKMILAILLLTLTSMVTAQELRSIDSIYQLFMVDSVDVEAVSKRYLDDIIHVGENDKGLLRGKEQFLHTNIIPLKNMLATGDYKLSLKAYIVRRIEHQDMANDVGFLYSKITLLDGNTMEQVQKFSWVFIKEQGVWKVATDFDKTQASLQDLETAISNGARLIEAS